MSEDAKPLELELGIGSFTVSNRYDMYGLRAIVKCHLRYESNLCAKCISLTFVDNFLCRYKVMSQSSLDLVPLCNVDLQYEQKLALPLLFDVDAKHLLDLMANTPRVYIQFSGFL